VPIADAVMRENRDAYRAINSPGTRSSHEYVAEAVEPEAEADAEPDGGKSDAGKAEGELESSKKESARFGPDPRREAAQKAAKKSWANWAIKKTG
jgi:hypothetical protein